jgi:hypothetical protein
MAVRYASGAGAYSFRAQLYVAVLVGPAFSPPLSSPGLTSSDRASRSLSEVSPAGPVIDAAAHYSTRTVPSTVLSSRAPVSRVSAGDVRMSVRGLLIRRKCK